MDPEATGPVRVETYTVTFDREGHPERGIVACRTKADARAWGSTFDTDALRALCAEDPIGRSGHCRRTGPSSCSPEARGLTFHQASRAGGASGRGGPPRCRIVRVTLRGPGGK